MMAPIKFALLFLSCVFVQSTDGRTCADKTCTVTTQALLQQFVPKDLDCKPSSETTTETTETTYELVKGFSVTSESTDGKKSVVSSQTNERGGTTVVEETSNAAGETIHERRTETDEDGTVLSNNVTNLNETTQSFLEFTHGHTFEKSINQKFCGMYNFSEMKVRREKIVFTDGNGAITTTFVDNLIFLDEGNNSCNVVFSVATGEVVTVSIITHPPHPPPADLDDKLKSWQIDTGEYTTSIEKTLNNKIDGTDGHKFTDGHEITTWVSIKSPNNFASRKVDWSDQKNDHGFTETTTRTITTKDGSSNKMPTTRQRIDQETCTHVERMLCGSLSNLPKHVVHVVG